MRLVVMYDLPMTDKFLNREYNHFHNFLIKEGFHMIQYSIYNKIFPNNDNVERQISRLEKNCPKKGHVRCFSITESQYSKMKILVGSKTKEELILSDKRLVIL